MRGAFHSSSTTFHVDVRVTFEEGCGDFPSLISYICFPLSPPPSFLLFRFYVSPLPPARPILFRVLSPYMLVVPRPGKIKKKIFTRSRDFFVGGWGGVRPPLGGFSDVSRGGGEKKNPGAEKFPGGVARHAPILAMGHIQPRAS